VNRNKAADLDQNRRHVYVWFTKHVTVPLNSDGTKNPRCTERPQLLATVASATLKLGLDGLIVERHANVDLGIMSERIENGCDMKHKLLVVTKRARVHKIALLSRHCTSDLDVSSKSSFAASEEPITRTLCVFQFTSNRILPIMVKFENTTMNEQQGFDYHP
jgi:hypothetical protein